jgi:hypothetical protein
MGYLLLAGSAAVAVYGWRSPHSDIWYCARVAAVLALLIAVQLWWQL